MAELFLNGKVELRPGDCRDRIREMPDNSVDSVVTDPPYALVSITKRFGGENAAPARDGDVYSRSSAGFMGKQWDTGETAFAVEFWQDVLRVLKPGGHVVAFSGTRTYHRMAVAIEDAGFEIRDQLAWMYGQGFPKSHDVSKGIDKAAGAEREKVRIDAADLKNPPNLVGGAVKGDDRPWRLEAIERGYHEKDGNEPATPEAAQWQGWGTALKPAWEPICLARKPLSEKSVAANVLRWGTGALNIDGCRVGMSEADAANINSKHAGMDAEAYERAAGVSLELSVKPMALIKAEAHSAGRWPANIAHDGSEEVLAGFPETGPSSDRPRNNGEFKSVAKGKDYAHTTFGHSDNGGSAARFFYTAKADAFDRISSRHPTVKPVDLIQYYTRLITPPGGVTLDPFAGSGTTGEAAFIEGFRAILIEREAEYCDDIRKRLEMVMSSTERRKQESKRRQEFKPADDDIFLM